MLATKVRVLLVSGGNLGLGMGLGMGLGLGLA